MLGGGIFEKLGIHAAFPNQKDQGRYEVTGDTADRMRFKVSQLRNVALTGPYFHDGSVSSLEEAVDVMARLELDLKLSEE